MPDFGDTIVALITPPGTGGIAVLRLSGADAIQCAAPHVHGPTLTAVPSHTVHHGHYATVEGEELDEVLATVFRGPHSYTGEDVVEISCHGSPLLAGRILGDLVLGGARQAEPGEFTKRAFLNGRIDLSQAEAVADLVAATSRNAAAIAERQLRGELARRIGQVVDKLVEACGLLELGLDFIEERIEIVNTKDVSTSIEWCISVLEQLVASYDRGKLIKLGIAVAILGRPNVGKSTLLNALAGRRKAIVSEIPGTTRDVIEAEVSHRGYRLEFWDTAGLRDNPDPIERMGIEMAREKGDLADVCMIVHDPTEIESGLDPVPDPGRTEIHVLNKRDLIEGPRLDVLSGQLHGVPIIPVSALTGAGVDRILERVVGTAETPEVSGDSFSITNLRHVECLNRALGHLRGARQASATESEEFTATRIRAGLDVLGEIVGTVTSSEILDAVFARFCIGK